MKERMDHEVRRRRRRRRMNFYLTTSRASRHPSLAQQLLSLLPLSLLIRFLLLGSAPLSLSSRASLHFNNLLQ